MEAVERSKPEWARHLGLGPVLVLGSLFALAGFLLVALEYRELGSRMMIYRQLSHLSAHPSIEYRHALPADVLSDPFPKGKPQTSSPGRTFPSRESDLS